MSAPVSAPVKDLPQPRSESPQAGVPTSQPEAATDFSQASGSLTTRLGELYRLADDELRVLTALLGCSCGKSVAELATELSLPLPQLLLRLAPEGVLRGRALVEAPESAALGWAVPTDVLIAGRGLVAALQPVRHASGFSDERTLFVATLPGVSYMPAPAPDSIWAGDLAAQTGVDRASEKPPQAVVDLVREHLLTPQPTLLSLGGVQIDQLTALAQVVRQRQQRPVVTLDGSALAGWPTALVSQALRRLRRDTDLRGAILLIHEVRAIGSAWRSVLLPRPQGQTAPLIVASDGPALALGPLPVGPRAETAWTQISVTLRPQPLPSPAASLSPALSAPQAADASEDHEDPALAASRQEARRQAAIDAARAMGRPVPKDLIAPIAKPAAPQAASVAAPGAATPQAAARVSAPVEAPAPTQPIAKPAAAPSPAADAAQRRAMNPRLAAALAAAGLPPPGSDEYGSSEYAQRRAAARAAAAAEAASRPAPTNVTSAAQPAPAAAEPSSAAAESAHPSAAPDSPAMGSTAVAATEPVQESQVASPAAIPEDEGAPLPLDAEAPLEELVRVARTTPSSLQRAEVLRKLTGARHSAVIQLFRAFVSSQHPAVREAAEGGMSSLFGPNWNRTRSIAPPAQPPRSEDGGRGPGGAF